METTHSLQVVCHVFSSVCGVSVQVVATFEGLHQGPVACGCLADDYSTLVLGGLEDCMITVWNLHKSSVIAGFGSHWVVTHVAALIGHLAPITHVAVSHEYGTLVSASEDGAVLLWDLSKQRVIAPLIERPLPFSVTCIKVRNSAVVLGVPLCASLVVCTVLSFVPLSVV